MNHERQHWGITMVTGHEFILEVNDYSGVRQAFNGDVVVGKLITAYRHAVSDEVVFAYDVDPLISLRSQHVTSIRPTHLDHVYDTLEEAIADYDRKAQANSQATEDQGMEATNGIEFDPVAGVADTGLEVGTIDAGIHHANEAEDLNDE